MARRPQSKGEQDRFIQRKGPKQDRSRVTVDSIKQATLDLLAKNGAYSLSVAKISARAGVSTGTFYDYFPNKEAVLLSLFESASTQLASVMRDHMAGMLEASIDQVVAKGIRQLLSLHEQHRLVVIDLVKELPELKLAEHPLSFSSLGQGSLLVFLQHRAKHMTFDELKCKAFFIHNVLDGTIREYLSDSAPYISRQKLLSNLAQILTPYMENIIDLKLPTLDTGSCKPTRGTARRKG